MQSICEGLILSKKGFGTGHLILNFLDSHLGKITPISYGAALETGKRRASILSGSFIQGLLTTNPRNPEKLLLSDTKSLMSLDNLRQELRPMGFTLFTLEILDMILQEGEEFPYYAELYHAFELFDQYLDEKYVLFFLAKFLGGEGWLVIPEQGKLTDKTKRFLEDAQTNPVYFLQGKNISSNRKHELSYFFVHVVKRACSKKPNSLELLRFTDT